MKIVSDFEFFNDLNLFGVWCLKFGAYKPEVCVC